MKTRKILSALLAAAMTCAMCLSVGAADVPADSVDGYPTNANGETYGSYFDRHKYGYAPDLIAALGDDGTEGYIRRELAKSVNLRNTPQIRFIMDQSIEYGVNMSKMIDDVCEQDESKAKSRDE